MNADILHWSRRQRWLVILGLYCGIAVWQAGVFIADNVANGKPPRVGVVLLQEVIAALCACALLPPLLAFFQRAPLVRGMLLRRLPLYLLVWLAYGIALTLLLYASRTIAYHLLGWGRYDYGQFLPRLAMETVKQFFVISLIYLVWLFVNTLREAERERLRTAHLEKALAASRLQTLQMQLNPHFLFNTLNVVSSTMYEDVDAADRMIARLSELLRRTLDGVNWQEHPLRRELELLTLYVDTMKERFREKLDVRMEISPDALEALVPGFVLQPLVENSIEYSMERRKCAIVKITARRTEGQLMIRVADNGPGIEGNWDAALKGGIGLANITERLRTLYGSGQRFEIRNLEAGGLEIVMRIPYRAEKGEGESKSA